MYKCIIVHQLFEHQFCNKIILFFIRHDCDSDIEEKHTVPKKKRAMMEEERMNAKSNKTLGKERV